MDFSTLAGAALVAAFVLFLIAIARLSGDGPGLAELFKSTTDLGWPKGIQEEDPVRWRVELLKRHDTEPAVGRDGSTHADRRATYPIS